MQGSENANTGNHNAVVGHTFTIRPNLLNELRIDGQQRDSEGGGGPPRWVWPVLALVVVAALLAGAAWWFFMARPIAVQTAAAMAPRLASMTAGTTNLRVIRALSEDARRERPAILRPRSTTDRNFL